MYKMNLCVILFSIIFSANHAQAAESIISLSCNNVNIVNDPMKLVDKITVSPSSKTIEMFASSTKDKWIFDERGIYNDIIAINKITINSDPDGSFQAAGFRETTPFNFKYDKETSLLTYSYLLESKPKFIIYSCRHTI